VLITDNIHGDNDGSNVISTYVHAAYFQPVCVCVWAVLFNCHYAHSKQLDVFMGTVYVLLLLCSAKCRNAVPELHPVSSPSGAQLYHI
jgi:hypothetical protein